MRRLKNKVMLVLAVLPLLTYALVVFRSGVAPEFVTLMQETFGAFGAFFEPLFTPLLTEYVNLTSVEGVAFFSWIVGYYISLLFVYLIWSLFTFLITLFMDKIDKIGGN